MHYPFTSKYWSIHGHMFVDVSPLNLLALQEVQVVALVQV